MDLKSNQQFLAAELKCAPKSRRGLTQTTCVVAHQQECSPSPVSLRLSSTQSRLSNPCPILSTHLSPFIVTPQSAQGCRTARQGCEVLGSRQDRNPVDSRRGHRKVPLGEARTPAGLTRLPQPPPSFQSFRVQNPSSKQARRP